MTILFMRYLLGCLGNLEKVFCRCKEMNLILNLKFNTFHGSRDRDLLWVMWFLRVIEVDMVKVKVIKQLSPCIDLKLVKSFLGYVGFYQRFIKDFSHIARPLIDLLAKYALFLFTDTYLKDFNMLKHDLQV